tara:strand:+ start:36158 stop:36436 length:279 start_codon:yes stop_codon:yes gene_type:complete
MTEETDKAAVSEIRADVKILVDADALLTEEFSPFICVDWLDADEPIVPILEDRPAEAAEACVKLLVRSSILRLALLASTLIITFSLKAIDNT